MGDRVQSRAHLQTCPVGKPGIARLLLVLGPVHTPRDGKTSPEWGETENIREFLKDSNISCFNAGTE